MTVTFVVNGQTEIVSGGTVDSTFAGWNATTARIGSKREQGSSLPGFNGDLRFLAVWNGEHLNVGQHNTAADEFAASLGSPGFYPTAPLPSADTITLWLDVANTSATAQAFTFPPVSRSMAQRVGSTEVVRVCGLGSAGIELPSLQNEVCGGEVRLSFRIRLIGFEATPTATAPFLSVGDAVNSVVLYGSATNGSVWWAHATATTDIVPVAPHGSMTNGSWTTVRVLINQTHATTAIGASNSTTTVVHGATTNNVWTYFGLGFWNSNASVVTQQVTACAEVNASAMTSSC